MRNALQRLLLIGMLVALFVVWAVVVGAQPAANTPVLATTVTPIYGDEDAKPVIMLTVFDPWRAVIGSDSPAFALYETGQVIYGRVNEDGVMEYFTAMLDEEAVAELAEQLDLEAFAELDDYYDLAMITDQPIQTFTTAGEFGGVREIGVYGSLLVDEEVRAAAPDILVDAYDLLTTYENPDAEPWLPTHFEVILWPWDTSDSVDWPADFPQLDSPFAVRRQEVTSIYVETSEYERFRELAQGEDALQLDGKTYSFTVRWPFPHEVTWPTTHPDATAEATDKPKS